MVAARGCTVIAHRGGAGEAPENTWTAVEHVAELGLTWMETDLRVSADGLVILSHDSDLMRTAADPRGIGELTWKELSELDAGDGRPPVRLDDALVAFPRLRFNIDLKESAVVQDALQVVRAADALASPPSPRGAWRSCAARSPGRRPRWGSATCWPWCCTPRRA